MTAPLPQVALPFMNDDHAEAAELFASLVSALQEKNIQQISHSLRLVIEHCEQHFDREETLMKQYNFPATHCHEGEHKRVLTQLGQLEEEWGETQDLSLMEEWAGQFPSWLQNHIATMDTVTANFIAMQGAA